MIDSISEQRGLSWPLYVQKMHCDSHRLLDTQHLHGSGAVGWKYHGADAKGGLWSASGLSGLGTDGKKADDTPSASQAALRSSRICPLEGPQSNYLSLKASDVISTIGRNTSCSLRCCFFNRAWRSSSNFCFRSVSSCAGHASFRGRHIGESRSSHKHWSDRVGVPCFQTHYDAQQTFAALPRLPRAHRTNCNESWFSCQAITSSGKHLLLDAEHGAIGPHGVEHDRKFAGHGNQRAVASFLAGQPRTETA